MLSVHCPAGTSSMKMRWNTWSDTREWHQKLPIVYRPVFTQWVVLFSIFSSLRNPSNCPLCPPSSWEALGDFSTWTLGDYLANCYCQRRGGLMKSLWWNILGLKRHKLDATKLPIKFFLIVSARTLGWSPTTYHQTPRDRKWSETLNKDTSGCFGTATRHGKSIRRSHGFCLASWQTILCGGQTADMVQQDRLDTRNWPEAGGVTISGAEAPAVTWFLVRRAISALSTHHHHSYCSYPKLAASCWLVSENHSTRSHAGFFILNVIQSVHVKSNPGSMPDLEIPKCLTTQTNFNTNGNPETHQKGKILLMSKSQLVCSGNIFPIFWYASSSAPTLAANVVLLFVFCK